MRFLGKIINYEYLPEWKAQLASQRQPLVVTNGCFDCLHVGHVHLLASARDLGASLLVGLTNDDGIRRLKGVGRPINSQRDRLLMLAALEMVDFVCLFPEAEATVFLQKARPDIYVKGGDYSIDTINQNERAILEANGARIKFISRFEERSSSGLIRQIQAQTNLKGI